MWSGSIFTTFSFIIAKKCFDSSVVSMKVFWAVGEATWLVSPTILMNHALNICLSPFFLILKERSKWYAPCQTMWVLTWILCWLIWRWNKTSHLEWLMKDWGALDDSPLQYHSSRRQQKHHVLKDYLTSVSLCWSRNIRQGGHKGWIRLYNERCHWQQWCQWLERTPIFLIWRRTSLMKIPFLRWWVPIKVEGLDQTWYHYCKDINHLSKKWYRFKQLINFGHQR